MTFDLAKLDTAKVAEEGAELHVAHPTTGEDLGITITLIGTDSKTFRDISKSRATASLKKKTREIDLDQNEQDSIELLARCTKGWARRDARPRRRPPRMDRIEGTHTSSSCSPFRTQASSSCGPFRTRDLVGDGP